MCACARARMRNEIFKSHYSRNERSDFGINGVNGRSTSLTAQLLKIDQQDTRQALNKQKLVSVWIGLISAFPLEIWLSSLMTSSALPSAVVCALFALLTNLTRSDSVTDKIT